ncbi:sensor histidine kinase [Bacillus sp. HMF5848]|uniref:sensor histidine kinase n=1 Tax=Bacillus sp. HMF5848 TaxID=2495421 RepID=UPI000F779C70|nr:sensor histidine kinase [Bacillus sp. HMF5848]RSK26005.1 sensor histidine kinase [Bacillus sp. HMF5848]
MNIVQRQIMFTMLLSLFIFALLLVAFVMAYPLSDWRDLWNGRVMDLPFIVFAPVISVAIGGLFGTLNGVSWGRQLQTISDALQQLEQGKKVDVGTLLQQADLQQISTRVERLQKQITEQTKLSQKLANERAEKVEKRIQEIVSEERNRLARELHDSVSQQLFAASMMMSAINETIAGSEREAKQLKMVENMIHQSQLEMRALLLHLRPAALKGKSLQEGIKELLTELKQKVPLSISWKVEDLQLTKGVEDHLFRILQESVSNTLRHSRAQALEVLLIERDHFIILRVVDDGVGFDVSTSKSGSYGLQNMHERAVEIGGLLKIVSLKNQGTRLEVKVPIVTSEGDNDD